MNELALSQLPKPILDELEVRQRNIVLAEVRSFLRKGEELKKAQDLLAKHGYGCFGEWLDYIGLPRSTAYDCIDRYEVFVRNSDKPTLKDLSLTLIDAYRKKSGPPEINV